MLNNKKSCLFQLIGTHRGNEGKTTLIRFLQSATKSQLRIVDGSDGSDPYSGNYIYITNNDIQTTKRVEKLYFIKMFNYDPKFSKWLNEVIKNPMLPDIFLDIMNKEPLRINSQS